MNVRMTNTMIKTYSELIQLKTFEDRYRYLQLKGSVGYATFGSERHLNQTLYTSPEWKRFRREIIIRDDGCDLACEDRTIGGRILIHHINPITPKDIINRSSVIFDPENVVCVSHMTHEAIHYGDESLLILQLIERTPNDTCPWKGGKR